MPMAKKNSDAEEIFRKNQDEMTDIEKMMAEILSEYGSEAQPEKAEEEDLKPVYASPAPPAKRNKRSSPEADSKVQKVARMRAESRETNTAYTKNSREEREKNIREAARKRSSAPLVIILVMILMLVVGALVYPKMFEAATISPPPKITVSTLSFIKDSISLVPFIYSLSSYLPKGPFQNTVLVFDNISL